MNNVERVFWRLKIYGVLGIFTELLIRRKSWNLGDAFVFKGENKTSISDATSYVEVCKLAVLDPDIFANFRRCLEYRLVLEHVTKKFGKKYLSLALRNKNSLEFYNNMRSQNLIGNPFLSNFKKIGKASPTSIRYLKVLIQLIDIFGSLDRKTIAEIGGGFGGQAHAIVANQKLEKYYVYDLPEVLKLSEKFLDELIDTSIFEFIDGRNPPQNKCDLVISNYAFSELTRDTQLQYLNSVILNSNAGYITWNELSFKELGGFSLAEVLTLIPGSFLIPEEPLTFKGNIVVVWGCN